MLSGSIPAEASGSYADYSIKIDPDLSEMHVQLCFADEVADVLTSESDVAYHALKELHINGRPVAGANRSRHKINLPGLQPHQCLDYTVATVIAMAGTSIPRVGLHRQKDIILPVSAWLWVPDINTRDKNITLSFVMPPGVRVSAPWKPIAHSDNRYTYEFGRSPADWLSLIAVGRFEIDRIPVSGATLRLAILGGLNGDDAGKIRRWIEYGAASIINIYGRFPLPSPQVLVVPVGKRDEPVPWGQVLRGGTPAVQLFIDASRPFRQFRQDWTLVHELSHFLHPKLGMEGAWLAEGIASYYQNIAQARAGTVSELQAWQKLYEGFQRGIRQTRKGRTLEQESRDMYDSYHFMRIYWSGAAIALLADFSLRKNGQSLDEILSRFQQCCLLQYRYWDTQEFMQELDSLGKTTVFNALYNEYAHSDRFPELRQVYQQLGLEMRNGKLTFNNQAEASDIREQIMSHR